MKNVEEYEDNLVVKMTFEDTLKAQQKLRKILLVLINENRCLQDDERDLFFDLLARSTFGLGISKRFKIFYPSVVDFSDVESGARWLASQNVNPLVIHRENLPDTEPIQINVLWQRLLDLLYGVFPIALDRSSAMSREIPKTIGGDGFVFTPDE
ncbi:MAG: hypothetical protein H7836_14615 [Magnetococcus sp. YQC-3]